MINEIILILRKRQRQVALTFLLIVAGVIVLTLLTPKQYETRMKILVKGERANVDGTASFREVSETQVNTEIELLTSSNLLEQVVKSTGLQRKEGAAASSTTDKNAIAVEKAVSKLQKDLKITPVRKANIIDVKYTATDPHYAAVVLREYAERYLDSHLKVNSTPGTYEFFSGQAQRYREELKAIEAELTRFREKDDVILLQQQKEATLQKSMETQSALLQTQTSIGEAQTKIDQAGGQLAVVTGRVVTQSRVASNQYLSERLNTMLAELQNKRTLLLTKFRSDDRTVREVDQEIADTQAAIEKAGKQTGVEQTTDVNPVRQSLELDLSKNKAELAGLQTRQMALTAQEQAYRAQLLRLDGVTSQYDDLVRHQREVEENYLLYSKKGEEARIAESLDTQKISNVAIVETPSEPHLPSKPNVPLNLVAGTLLAACVSLGTALSAEYFQHHAASHWQTTPALAEPAESALSFSSRVGSSHYLLSHVDGPSDLEELTGLPVLALLDGR